MGKRYVALLGLLVLFATVVVAANKRFTLVIDAGHGGNDAGARGKFLERKEHQPQRGAGLRALCGAQLPRRQGDIHTQDRRLRDPARTGQHCQPQQGRPVCVDSYQRPAQGKDCPWHGDIHPGNAPSGRQPRRGKARELGDIVRRQLQAALRGVRPAFV